jgi:hypothetical protein
MEYVILVRARVRTTICERSRYEKEEDLPQMSSYIVIVVCLLAKPYQNKPSTVCIDLSPAMASTSAAAADSAPVALPSFSTVVGVVGQLKPWSQLDAEEPLAIFRVKHWGVPLPGSTPERESFPLKLESPEGDQDCTILVRVSLSVPECVGIRFNYVLTMLVG